MRFSELQLIRYGRFQDCSLSFPAGECDLHLIVGPNEAGKSTTLAAVSDLLFGFEPRTSYAFLFPQTTLRVGGVIETDGARIELRRRKGNVNTLLSPEDQPLDSAVLSRLLAGQSRSSFRRMFGLDHASLRAGGKLMLANKDDVGAAIFAAGSGLTQVTSVCEELDTEAKAIWARNAGEGRFFNRAHSAYQEAKAALKDAEIKPAAWAKARRELEDIEAELGELKVRRSELVRRQRVTQRRQLALGPLARRDRALVRLAELAGVPELSEEAAERLEAALQAAVVARTGLGLADEEIARLQSELEAARPKQALLDVAGEVEALRDLKGLVDESSSKLPAIQADIESVDRRIAAAVKEIGWPLIGAPELKARLPGRPEVQELRELIERRSGIDQQLLSAREAIAEASATVERLSKERAELPAVAEVAPLQDLLRHYRTAGLSQAREKAEADRNELHQHLQAQLRALAPWSGDIASLRGLAFPADEDVHRRLEELEGIHAILDTEMATASRESDRLAQLRLDRQHKVLAHPTPTFEDLRAARMARDGLWDPVRKHALGESPLIDPAAALGTYEKRLAEADLVADERFAGAEHAGGLAELEREIEKCELRVSQAQKRCKEAEAKLGAMKSGFEALLRPIGFTLSPEAYLGWRETCRAALEHADVLDRAERELGRLQDAESAARSALRRAMPVSAGLDDSASLLQLVAEAERIVDAAAEARAFESRLDALRHTAGQSLEAATRQERRAVEADAGWTRSWRDALASAGLVADASVASARARLELIDGLRMDVDIKLDLQARANGAVETIERFERRVRVAAEQAGAHVTGGSAATFLALQNGTEAARAAAERVQRLRSELDAVMKRKEESARAAAAAEALLVPLAIVAGGENPTDLRRVLEQAAEAGRLRHAVDELEREILSHGDGLSLEALAQETSGAEPEALAADADEVARELDDLAAVIDSKTAAWRDTELAFQAVDDRPDAAIAAFAISEARSEMAFQAELYVRKRAEARLLRLAIERYREEKQGPLLSRASALFSTLTLGGYSRLMVDYHENEPKLTGVRANGDEVPVEGMSEGTVDQLYLALRVAAVEDTVAQGVRLPFLADDLFINFDDERAAAGFKVLAELSTQTQVMFFTHHAHLAAVASQALKPAKISVCGLEREAAGQTVSNGTVG